MPPAIIAVIVIVVLIAFMILLTVAVRYKTCPPDKILIIYGKISPNPDGTYRSAKCVHGGASFVMPFFQKYTFMDLTPLAISVDLALFPSRTSASTFPASSRWAFPLTPASCRTPRSA